MTAQFNKVTTILALLIAGADLDPDQRAALDAWLAASPQNERLLKRLLSGQSATEYCEHSVGGDPLRALERQWRRRRTAWWAASAAAACLVAAAALWPSSTKEVESVVATAHVATLPAEHSLATLTVAGRCVELTSSTEDEWREHVTPLSECVRIDVPAGHDYKMRLPDGTQVWLNAGSAIEYVPQGFDRSVSVWGETFFDVVRDTERPFVVAAPDGLQITVLGTRFNVSTAGGSIVSLVQGSVAVGNVVLKPSQQALLEDGVVRVRPVEDMRAVTAWVDGRFYFRGASVATVVAELEQWYGVSIGFDGAAAARIGSLNFISRRDLTLEEVLHSLNEASGIELTVND